VERSLSRHLPDELDPAVCVAVSQLYARYCHSVDRVDAASLATCFTTEAVLVVHDAGTDERRVTVEGGPRIVDRIVETSRGRPSGYRHIASNVLIAAASRPGWWAVTATFQVLSDIGETESVGTYEDMVSVADDRPAAFAQRAVRYQWRRSWVA
jgi:hypothetical protein